MPNSPASEAVLVAYEVKVSGNVGLHTAQQTDELVDDCCFGHYRRYHRRKQQE